MKMFDGPPPQAAPQQPALSGSHHKPPALLEVLDFSNDRTSRAWSDRNLYWATWYAENVQADGIYFDQLSCIAGGLQETAWNLERILTQARQYVPGFITVGEGVGQAHGRNLAFGLASAVFHRTELYRYTFPHHLVMDGIANGACNWGGGDQRFNVVFLNGCRFDNLPADEVFREKMMNLRLRTKQLLYRATFRDTDGVEVTLPADVLAPAAPTSATAWLARFDGIQAKRFILNTADSKLVLVNTINTLNATGAKATVETNEVGLVRAAWAFLWDGTLQRIPVEHVFDTRVAFEVPTVEQATVVLVNTCEPLVYVDMPARLPPSGQGEALVQVLNLNPTLIQGTIGWELPEGWTDKSASFDSIGPGETQGFAMSVTASADAPRQIHDLWCVATSAEGVKGRKYAPVSVVPTPYVTWEYSAGGALQLTLENLRSEAAAGSVVVEFPPGTPVGTAEGEQWFDIPPHREANVVFHFTELSQLEEPIGIHILVRSSGAPQRIPIRLFPAITNGGFEIDLAGDGKPEYWTTYDYSGKISMREIYPRVNLDVETRHGGRSSLRIDPLIALQVPAEGLGVSRNCMTFVRSLAGKLKV